MEENHSQQVLIDSMLRHWQMELVLRSVITLLNSHQMLHNESRMRALQIFRDQYSEVEMRALLTNKQLPPSSFYFESKGVKIEITTTEEVSILELLRGSSSL